MSVELPTTPLIQRNGKDARPSRAGTLATASHPFAINFIRRRFIPQQTRSRLVYTGLGYLALHGLVLIVFLLVATVSWVQSGRLRRHLSANGILAANGANTMQDIGMLQMWAQEDVARLNRITELQHERLPIAGKLAALARTIPPRTWITRASGSREHGTISVEAVYLNDPDAPYHLPMKEWIEALQADPAFQDGLEALDFENVSRKTQGVAEVFLFELVGAWKR